MEHARVLLSCGCELAQGYGIARPMTAEDLPVWHKQWQRDKLWESLGEPSKAR